VKRAATISETAEALSVHPKTVERAIRRGEIAATHIGAAIRIPPAELERLGIPHLTNEAIAARVAALLAGDAG
jgi:excisionase family DNA binding protein